MVITTKDVVDKLKKSAMFNLSLSSKELFHSNFIDWLISVNKDGMSKVFSNLLRSESEIKIKDCSREWNNFDLYIECEDSSPIIIENKFKSIITEEQLEKYNKKAGTTPKKLLLSLNSSVYEEELAEKRGWHLINYTQLCDELEKLTKTDKYLTNKYHRQLIEDYCSFVNEISTYFSDKKFSEDTLSDMHNEVNIFKKIRLHDVYQKILFNYLLRELKRKLRDGKSDFAQGHDPRRAWQDFWTGKGTVSLDYVLNDKRKEFRLELQLQGDHLKLLLIHPNKEGLPKKDIDNFFDIISDLAKNSEYCENGKLYPIPNRKNKEYNVYGKNIIYKRITLKGSLTFDRVIDIFYKTFKKVVEFGKKTDKNM